MIGAGWSRLAFVAGLPALVLLGCGGTSSTDASSSAATGSSTSSTSTGSTSSTGSTAASTTTVADGTTTLADTTAARSSTSESSGTTAGACAKNVVLMGYWPPTNEMLRPWSEDLEQNPDGWIGANWEGYGYDVRAFFPEFPPDGDPSNDPIGSDGSVGSPRHDLQVDYQATSLDFWRIVDEHRPVLLVSTSRGSDIGWEIEAVEGGHGVGNPGGPELDWASDGYPPYVQPEQTSIEPASWDAISTYRQGTTLATRLPVDAIVAATSALALTDVAIDPTGTSGNFLSGYLGLHGLYYAEVWAPQAGYQVAAAGHIHVGTAVAVDDAHALVQATLRAVLEAHPVDTTDCP